MRNTHVMDFAVIDAFVAVAQLGGFTRAAGALHVSQPALSRRIALLEHELGRPAFDRGRAGASLTDVGRTFLPHAQAALACVRDGVAAVRALDAGEGGEVTLAIVGTLASSDLTALLERFRDRFPRSRLLLRTGSSAEVSDLVRSGAATVGLRYFADPARDVVSEVVAREPLVVVAAAQHPIASARRIPAARLRDQSWVAFPARRGKAVDPFGQVLASRLAAAGLEGSEVVTIDSLTAQKRLVEAGFGLALVPASGVREELALGTLRQLDVPGLRASADVVLIRRKAAVLGPAAGHLVAALAALGEPPAEGAE
jgi:DNA-binding transcriptional LysR family regulator